MPVMSNTLTVGEIALLTGVTVRTLHHYDEIGLVRPDRHSDNGYRLYGSREIERLQEVLLFRELGLGLEEIRQIVSDSGYQRLTALERHRRMIESKANHLLGMIDAIDATIAAERNGTTMTNKDMLGVFGDFNPDDFEDEAKEAWGDTDAYRESAQRTARYTKQDWEQMKREDAEINSALAALMESGTLADSPEAMDLAERHRSHLSKWFYECTPEIHAGLGQVYIADSRFTENIDRTTPGLAAYLSAAIASNCDRLQGR